METASKLSAALGVDVAELVPELKTLLKEKPEPPPMEPIFEDNGFLTARMTAIQKRAYEIRKQSNCWKIWRVIVSHPLPRQKEKRCARQSGW